MKLAYITRSAAGFTLIEMLLYVALVSMLLIAITGFFGLSADARVKNQTIAEVDQQGTQVMDYITQTIRNASSISAPAIGTSASSLTAVVPTASLSPTVISLNGTALQTVEGSASAVPLTSSRVQVSSLTFKNLARSGTNANLQISFVITRTNPNSRNEYEYSKTFTSTAALQW
jgi:Tfp pilus assembly protein PilW